MARAAFEKKGKKVRWFLTLVAILAFAIAAFVAAFLSPAYGQEGTFLTVRSEALWFSSNRVKAQALRQDVATALRLEFGRRVRVSGAVCITPYVGVPVPSTATGGMELWDTGLRLQAGRSVYVEAGLERVLLAERIGAGQYWGGGFEWEVAAPVSVSVGVRYFRGDYRDWPTDRVSFSLGIVLYFDEGSSP